MSSPISGFTAIPNPQMLAFMPIQSYLMMFFAGAGWQIGKRKISAIPNDAFNKLSINDLLKMFTADLKASIPIMEKSLQDVTPMVGILVEQYGDFVKEAIKHLPTALQNALGPTAFQADNIGDLKAWLDKQLPPIPKDISAGAHSEPTTASTTGFSSREVTPLLLDYFKRQQEAEASTRIGPLKTDNIIPLPAQQRKRVSTQTARRTYDKLAKELSQAKSKLAGMPKTEVSTRTVRQRYVATVGKSGRGRVLYRNRIIKTIVVPYATSQQIAKIKSIQGRMNQEKSKYPWAF